MKRHAKTRNKTLKETHADYIAAHQADDVTARLNRVYEMQPFVLDPALVKIQVAVLAREVW